MSAERKKLLWISISACAFVLVVLAVGFFLMTPKRGGAQAPATIGNNAPPKAQDPQDYLSAPPPTPSLEQPRNQDGGMIIVYGDKPTLPAAAGSGTSTGSAVGGANGANGATGATGATAATNAGSTGTGAQSNAGQGALTTTGTPSGAAPTGAAPTGAATAAGAAKAAASNKSAAKPSLSAQKAGLTAKPSPKAEEYWIQAGSFTSRGRADELKQALADKGIAALISVKDISGKSYYRVRVGPYTVKAEATDWLQRLKGLPGSAEAYVTKNSVPKPKK